MRAKNKMKKTKTLHELSRSHGIPSPEPAGGPRCYRVIRFYQYGSPRVIKSKLSLAEAQNHCKREDTHGDGWFDGYDLMKEVKA